MANQNTVDTSKMDICDAVEIIGRNLQKILWKNVDNNERMEELQSRLNDSPKCLLVGEDESGIMVTAGINGMDLNYVIEYAKDYRDFQENNRDAIEYITDDVSFPYEKDKIKSVAVSGYTCFYNTSELKNVRDDTVEKRSSGILTEYIVKSDAPNMEPENVMQPALKGR
jgi:hypothetical protein